MNDDEIGVGVRERVTALAGCRLCGGAGNEELRVCARGERLKRTTQPFSSIPPASFEP